jgi:ubiquinone biosynthesis accessory factor UbiK
LAPGTVHLLEFGARRTVEVNDMEQFRIDEIARRLLDSVPPAFRSIQQDLETNFRSVLRSSLGKLDLVTREEFDTQTKVLQRTRSKLEELEKKVAEMEARGAAAKPESSGN